ncbi:hypothetical protein DL546_007455 [Coniochaeta pulveracea]|uniref:Uncharacterized protein n=1 Tax=Coniochaeta pulveracea TaxID=177199 RepID=A0A420YGJ3_9PEZI|nr:hypothetical protein DL546_007455 [Coniochaeta pulveracea]
MRGTVNWLALRKSFEQARLKVRLSTRSCVARPPYEQHGAYLDARHWTFSVYLTLLTPPAMGDKYKPILPAPAASRATPSPGSSMSITLPQKRTAVRVACNGCRAKRTAVSHIFLKRM